MSERRRGYRNLSLVCFVLALGVAVLFWLSAPYNMQAAGAVLGAIVLVHLISGIGLLLGFLGRARVPIILNALPLIGFWIAAILSPM